MSVFVRIRFRKPKFTERTAKMLAVFIRFCMTRVQFLMTIFPSRIWKSDGILPSETMRRRCWQSAKQRRMAACIRISANLHPQIPNIYTHGCIPTYRPILHGQKKFICFCCVDLSKMPLTFLHGFVFVRVA